MTDQELKDIVAAVVAELEKSGVDFDYKAEPAEDGDLVFVIRGTAPNYQGVTVTWKGLLDIITAQATQAKNDAETAKNAANTILEQVQSKGTEITNFVATSKAELETQKNESVNAVKSVYQTDLNELKGDLSAEQTAREEADNTLRADLTANANADAVTRRSLDALWKLNHGISYQFEQDNTESYQKIVHSGAKLASVEQIGGNTVVWNHLLHNGNFNSTKYWSARDSTLSTLENELTCEVNGGYGGFTAIRGEATVITGHKYYSSIDVKTGKGIKLYWPYFDYDIISESPIHTASGNYEHMSNISGAKINGTSLFGIRIASDQFIKATIKAKNAMMIDLTSMFGVGNEPVTTDDPRITWIEQYAAEHPEYNAGALVSAGVNCVKYNDAVVSVIPEAVCNLPGYGWSAGKAYNSIERTEAGWQYVQRVSSVDLGTLSWNYAERLFATLSGCRKANFKIPNIVCPLYTTTKFNDVYNNVSNKIISIHDNAQQVNVSDSDFTNAQNFKTAMSGVLLYYELETPIITNITDLMADFPENFPVEAGGTLTFENAAKLPVPSSVEYAVKISEVNV